MNLPNQIKLINDLVKENPDSTIRDFLTLLADIENIEHVVKNEDMARQIDVEQRTEIMRMASTLSPAEIHAQTKYAFSTIYRAMQIAGFNYKAEAKKRREVQKKVAAEKRAAKEAARADELEKRIAVARVIPKKEPMQRPPAEYSNRSPFGIASEYLNQKAAL